ISGGPTLINTIIAGSGPAGNCDYSSKQPTSLGHNLSDDSTCFMSGGFDVLNSPAHFTPLANDGGPTETIGLCTGLELPHPSCTGRSPAIDAGDDAVTGPPDNLMTDQRGLPRKVGAH